jgi:hypothetical protein
MKKQQFKQLIKECITEIQTENHVKKTHALAILGKQYVIQARLMAKKEFGI